MENINELLTSEQMQMLMIDLSHQDIVTLFLMNEDDRYHFFVEKFNAYSDKHCDYQSSFNYTLDKYYELLSAHDPDCDKYLDLLRSFLERMQHFIDYMKIYNILLTHV